MADIAGRSEIELTAEANVGAADAGSCILPRSRTNARRTRRTSPVRMERTTNTSMAFTRSDCRHPRQTGQRSQILNTTLVTIADALWWGNRNLDPPVG